MRLGLRLLILFSTVFIIIAVNLHFYVAKIQANNDISILTRADDLLSIASIPTQYIGTWNGSGVQQNPNTQWSIEITLTNSSVSEIDYPSLDCGGTLTLLNIYSDYIELREDITYGTNRCIVTGIVKLEQASVSGNTLNYNWDNGTNTTAQGVVRKQGVWGNLQNIQNKYDSRKGTNAAAYAHQFLCIASNSCEDYQENGDASWANSFVKYLFDYQAIHNVGKRGLDVTCPPMYTDWQCFKAASGIHGTNELQPAFFSYCSQYSGNTLTDYQTWESKWTNDHESFLADAFDQCFIDVINAGELPSSIGNDLRDGYKEIARKLRISAQLWCQATTGNLLNSGGDSLKVSANNFPEFPPPLTMDDLYSEQIALNTTLQITTNNDLFFLPIGTTLQLTVTKTNPDGSIIDLTSSASGTEYAIDIDIEESTVAITKNGVLSILGTQSPIAAVPQLLYVIVRNGEDLGIGQFAITDEDTDGDLIVNSYETKIDLNPNVPNSLASDEDNDGLSDFLEAMIHTQPIIADSDGDGFNDGFEINAGSDPLLSTCTPVRSCEAVYHMYLPAVIK